jgi:hypothetical protein
VISLYISAPPTERGQYTHSGLESTFSHRGCWRDARTSTNLAQKSGAKDRFPPRADLQRGHQALDFIHSLATEQLRNAASDAADGTKEAAPKTLDDAAAWAAFAAAWAAFAVAWACFPIPV